MLHATSFLLAIFIQFIDLNAFATPADLNRQFNIYPQHLVKPFKQWSANNGYCGEVSLLQAAMNQGEWISQYNVRLLCGTGLSQSGETGFCESHSGESNYNAQLLIENIRSQDHVFASASLCLKNAKLAAKIYPYWTAPVGMAGYQNFLIWIKRQLIQGNQVTLGVMLSGGHDQQYDHEVSVTRIGTNYPTSDDRYHDDDVLYFDDHHGQNGSESAYTFGSLAKHRAQANLPGADDYSVVIPGAFPTFSASGGNGIDLNLFPMVGQNYAFSVSGPMDPQKQTLPVTLTLVHSKSLGIDLPLDPIFQYNFEAPSLQNECTNEKPTAWMDISLKVEVTGLTPGIHYHLFEYDFDRVQGIGTDAALRVPESNFNTHASLATQMFSFTATSDGYSQTVQTQSDHVVVFRCVRADSN